MTQDLSPIEALNLEYKVFHDADALSYIKPLISASFPEYVPPAPAVEEEQPVEEVKEEAKVEEQPPPAPVEVVVEAASPVKGKKGKHPAVVAPPPPPPPVEEPEEEAEKPKKKKEPVLYQDWEKYHDKTDDWNSISLQLFEEPLFIKQDGRDHIVLAVQEKVTAFFKRYDTMGSFNRNWFEYDMARRLKK